MKVLVLGGCGFIGSHVVDALVAKDLDVCVLDRAHEKFRKPLNDVQYIIGDFSDKSLLSEALIGVDTVFHLVTTTFPSTADLDPTADVSSNLIATLNLLNLCISLKIRRVLYLSSGGTVYGIPKQTPVPETHQLSPVGSYGIVKAAIEFYLLSYMRRGLIDPVIVRASNPYGPRQGHAGVQGVISTFLHNIKAGRNIEIWGDGQVVRDYIHVTELADLCVRAGLSDLNGPLNAGSGVGLSVLDIVKAISKVVGKEIVPHFRHSQPTDVPISILDVSKAKTVLDWSPSLSIEDGLTDMWEWMNTVS
jgi:UDP-glucose 4-epimerase